MSTGPRLLTIRKLDVVRGAIVRLERDSMLRRRLGDAGREHVLADYPLDRMARAHEALYDRCLGARSTQAAGRFRAEDWAAWAPRDSVPLWLDIAPPPDLPSLKVRSEMPRAGTGLLVGRVWSRPFPGTAALVERRAGGAVHYILAEDGQAGELGYASRNGLPGMVPLAQLLFDVAPGYLGLGSIDGWVEPLTPPPEPLRMWASGRSR